MRTQELAFCATVLIVMGTSIVTASDITKCNFTIENTWPDGFQCKIAIPIHRKYMYGWVMLVEFNIPIARFKIYESNTIGQHPTLEQYVTQHKEYNKIIEHWTDKIMNLFCEGSQYVDGNIAIYKEPPSARILFIPHISETETVAQALKRANQGDVTEDMNTISHTTTTSTATTAPSTPSASTSSVALESSWSDFSFGSSFTTSRSQNFQTVKPTIPSYIKKFRYNLREVIRKSVLFFEAQRSGTLPKNNRINWRSHSGLRDGLDAGIDLTGGYYVDGSHIKYGLPMAFSMTVLAWGVLDFKRGYIASKELANTMSAIKWGTDYFIKCNPDAFTLYGQVSNVDTDNSYWGRAEDMFGIRPSYKLTRNRPGSDLAAETSAAMSAASLVFQMTHPEYAEKLRKHAIQLYKFAERYQQTYSKSIPQSENSFRPKSGYVDDLAWAAAWLYRATKDKSYLETAKERIRQDTNAKPVQTFDWDDKRAGVFTLMAQITNSSNYRNLLLDFCEYNIISGASTYTPKGLVYLSEQSTSGLASNAAFICLFVAELGIRPDTYRKFAQSQLNYLLGDTGQGFMVGFGNDSPLRPYHKGSSCPDKPKPCTFEDQRKNVNNPQKLIGALVNGPDRWDNYEDIRDKKFNGVGIHNNAGFQTLAAGILKLQVSLDTFSEPEKGELLPQLQQDFSLHHDYGEVLRKSNMFYEAQMSGELPTSHRIKWRKSACTKDSGTNGEDLSGGFFDGGDYIKFNFPMAFSTTVLAWGYILYPQSYEFSGEAKAVKKIIEWAADYFIKCHTSKNELYGQVGSSSIEHNQWIRPEDIKYLRPSYKITQKFPGSELAAETAAALAAAATIFKSKRAKYATKLINHAKQLFTFADKYRESYHRSIPDAAKFYPSFNGYKDELVWASLWLYIATGEPAYLMNAKSKYNRFLIGRNKPSSFYWDDKTAGINLLLARISRKESYISRVKAFCDGSLQKSGAKYTPRGLLFVKPWGPLRYASGNAFICLVAADLGIKPEIYRNFGKKQIHYMLGDSGLGSYVVGYGPSPPKRPYHRSSSCPVAPTPCNFTVLYSNTNNPHILHGALVGGPDVKDQFTDDITNHRSNKVALDYNAAFQSSIAALKYLEVFPPSTISPTTTKETATPTTIAFILDSVMTSKIPLTNNATTTEENVNYTTFFNAATGSDNINKYTSVESSLVELTTIKLTTIFPSLASSIPVSSTVISNITTNNPSITNSNNVSNNTTTIGISKNVSSINNTEAPSTTFSSTTTRSLGMETTIVSGTCGLGMSQAIFDFCAIPVEEFDKHPDRLIFRCRYNAFKKCVEVQTTQCTDDVWSYWPYWNHNANDSYWFSQEDVQCKNKQTLDVENCVLNGMMWAYNKCYENHAYNLVESRTNKEICPWTNYKGCVESYLGHCPRTWPYFDLWNRGLPTEKQFSNQDKLCSSCSKLPSSIFLKITWVIVILNVLFI